jgi:hypothetical protein
MQQKVFFINFEGPTLTDAFTEALFKTAQKMFHLKTEQEVLKNNCYEAVVTTCWRFANLGTIFGYEFSVKVECGNKTSTVKFLSRKTDLQIEDLAFESYIVPAGMMPMVTYQNSLN